MNKWFLIVRIRKHLGGDMHFKGVLNGVQNVNKTERRVGSSQ